MTPEPTDALMPCPFCGCKAVASINKGESLWSHDVVDWTRVHCTNDECNAQTEATCEGYEPSAVEVWNRRTPQPVAREPLSDAQIAEMMRDTWGCASIAPRHAMGFARAIEAEVRKQDEALIRQMHDALCECVEDSQEQLDRMEAAKLRQYKPQAVAFQESTIDAAKRAITAARARLGEKT